VRDVVEDVVPTGVEHDEYVPVEGLQARVLVGSLRD
jgi:hypothetical protein